MNFFESGFYPPVPAPILHLHQSIKFCVFYVALNCKIHSSFQLGMKRSFQPPDSRRPRSSLRAFSALLLSGRTANCFSSFVKKKRLSWQR